MITIIGCVFALILLLLEAYLYIRPNDKLGKMNVQVVHKPLVSRDDG